MGIIAILGLFLAGGAICGYVALSRLNALNQELQRLREALRDRDLLAPEYEDTRPATPPVAATTATESSREVAKAPPNIPMADESAPSPASHVTAGSAAISAAFVQIQKNWMIWLGASCVALAGVFLVRYSIDAGLLGPKARILLAVGFGIACHGVAEWVRRRSGWSHAALSALAGAGSLILYAAVFSALRLYDLLSPGTAFALMACVALATMVMAKLHGPLLAAFGILGAFLVPLLVGSEGGSIPVLLVYATVVSSSALLLMRYVYRPWLWWGFALGAVFWGVAASFSSGTGGQVSVYFTVLAYLVAAIPTFDFMLRRDLELTHRSYQPRELWANIAGEDRSRLLLYGLSTAAVCFAVIHNGNVADPWFTGVPFFVVTLWLARRNDTLFWLPWTSLLSITVAWVLTQLDSTGGQYVLQPVGTENSGVFLAFLAVTAAAASGFSLWNLPVSRRPAVFASMATLAPACLLAVAYLLIARPDVAWNWGLGTAILALSYLAIATMALRRFSLESLTVWLFVGGHFLLALAAAILWREASLTLALAAQLLSLAWVIQRFDLPGLGWLLKLVVAIVITRLTFNPWLPDYPTDVHWSFWTYGGSTVFAFAAARLLAPRQQLSAWAKAAALHLLVLSLWSELRYQLYGGRVYAPEFSFAEAAFSMLLLASLAIVYRYRLRFSESLGRFIDIYWRVLLTASAGIFALILLRTLDSSRWVYDAVSPTPLFNLGTLAFAGPVVLLALLGWQSRDKNRRVFFALAGLSAWVCISLQIRHLWSGTVRLNSPDISNSELYTYSAVWLVMAISAVLAGAWRFGEGVYRAGMLLLGLVIVKLFFWDMSGLEGLLRVASFMGLGLTLLGLSFLHQRLTQSDH